MANQPIHKAAIVRSSKALRRLPTSHARGQKNCAITQPRQGDVYTGSTRVLREAALELARRNGPVRWPMRLAFERDEQRPCCAASVRQPARDGIDSVAVERNAFTPAHQRSAREVNVLVLELQQLPRRERGTPCEVEDGTRAGGYGPGGGAQQCINSLDVVRVGRAHGSLVVVRASASDRSDCELGSHQGIGCSVQRRKPPSERPRLPLGRLLELLEPLVHCGWLGNDNIQHRAHRSRRLESKRRRNSAQVCLVRDPRDGLHRRKPTRKRSINSVETGGDARRLPGREPRRECLVAVYEGLSSEASPAQRCIDLLQPARWRQQYVSRVPHDGGRITAH
jgi:hypothetical protein